jgi:hypothetical protein
MFQRYKIISLLSRKLITIALTFDLTVQFGFLTQAKKDGWKEIWQREKGASLKHCYSHHT